MFIPLRNARRIIGKIIHQPGYAFSVGRRRLKAYFSYYFLSGKASLPEAITLFLTHRCNLRCKMCGQWGESGVTKTMSHDAIRQELSSREYKRLIDDLSRFKPNITLFGGEPLLHPSCIDIIKQVKEKNMHCLMITNGSLLEQFAHALVDAGLDELNVSLDGGKVLHDQIRGLPGVFKTINNGLEKVQKIKKEKGKNKPLINLQCTITQFNYKHLGQLLEVAKALRADSLTYHNLIFLGNDLIEKQKEVDECLRCSSGAWKGFVFEPGIDPDILYEEIQEILKGKHSFNVDFYPNLSKEGLRQYYTNPSYKPSEYPDRCVSAWIVAYVFPDGNVRPCLNSTYSFGNVKEYQFKNIWNSENAIRFRSMLKKGSIFPVCVRCTELYRY